MSGTFPGSRADCRERTSKLSPDLKEEVNKKPDSNQKERKAQEDPSAAFQQEASNLYHRLMFKMWKDMVQRRKDQQALQGSTTKTPSEKP